MMKGKLIIITACLALSSCASLDDKTDAYSRQWKASSVEERGKMADPSLCYRYLKGKTRQETEAFLGRPTGDDGDNWTYDIGTMGGPYRWTLWVRFDKDGIVTNVVGDD